MKSDLVKFREILAQLPFDKYWQIGVDTGCLLKSTIIKNKYCRALEVGTSCGYSALWLIEGLSAQEKASLDCIESHKERNTLAKNNIALVCPPNVECNVHLAHAPGCFESFDRPNYDFVFVDATKSQSVAIFEALYPCLNKGGTIFIDNVLSHIEKMQPFIDYLMKNKISYKLHKIDAGLIEVKKD
ncbi:hypothetical protein HOJ01_01805 [bacterium]|jgi:predicted O-methyltransferase YrrM|nr:hypothetical protein [bacterium]MBT6293519.1 hypothetical protein [bacterium]